MSIWQGSITPRRTSVPFWRVSKLGGALHLADSPRCCSVRPLAWMLKHVATLPMATLSRCLLVLAVAGCAAKKNYVTGTTIEVSESNKSVLAACEEYRLAVERQ